MFQIQGETFDEKLASVADLISTKKHIVVLAGAGISVSLVYQISVARMDCTII